MAVDKIDVTGDRRIEHKFADLNGHRYHYLHAVPNNEQIKGTIFLVHGWPDCSAGWRYQIPLLLDLGFQVVAPDLMGFGQTDCPHVPPDSLQLYSYKRASDDFAELARQLGLSRIVIGGHDWGGMVVWRFALHYPNLVTHVLSVCTPYTPPMEPYLSTEDLVNGPLPQFGYQLHLASPEVEGRIKSREQISQFLSGLFGARSPEGKPCFTPKEGVLFDVLPKLGKSPLLEDKELEYYVDQYCKNGLHGTVNWYRTRKVNWENDLALLKDPQVKQPSLFIQATHDSVLKPDMAKNMHHYIPNLTFAEVEAQHWALWQKPEECNAIIKGWIDNVVLGKQSKL